MEKQHPIARIVTDNGNIIQDEQQTDAGYVITLSGIINNINKNALQHLPVAVRRLENNTVLTVDNSFVVEADPEPTPVPTVEPVVEPIVETPKKPTAKKTVKKK